MSVEFKKNGNGKCPVMHGSMTEFLKSNTLSKKPKFRYFTSARYKN